MTCGSCAARVERTLGRHEGVASAGVNFATGRATVELDGASPATEGQLIGAVERVGYLAALHRPPPVGRTIEVSMSDDAYGPSVMTVAKGQRVRFVFHNEGRALHEALIGDAGLQAEHDRQMLSGHPHEPGLPVVDVPPGGKGVLLYTFTRSGQVLIGCRQPGHYSQGMRAVVTVL